MASHVILPLGTENAPADAVVPNAGDWPLQSVFAHFDGTSATGAWVPVLQILSSSGATVAEIPMDASVAAGASVEATWAPFLRSVSGGSARGSAACRIVNPFGQLIGSGADTDLSLTTADYDTDTMFNGILHPGRITFNTAGVYFLLAAVFYGANNTGERFLTITLNGSRQAGTGTAIAFEVVAAAPNVTTQTTVYIATQYQMAQGDYVTCATYQDSGVVLGIAGPPFDFFAAAKVE